MTSPGIEPAALHAGSGPLLFTAATIHTLDPAIGDLEDADLLLGGATIVAVGPGLHTAAGDDGATVVDCRGLSIVPVAGLSNLAPGSPATFAAAPGARRRRPLRRDARRPPARVPGPVLDRRRSHRLPR